MLNDLLKMLLDSYAAPRAAVRSVIDRVRGPADIAVIFGLSFTFNAIVLAVTLLGEGVEGILSVVIFNLIASVFSFGLLILVVTGAGRVFGGTGSLRDVAAAMAWHSLVTVIFAPFLSFDALALGAGLRFWAQIGILIVILWLLANYIAEAHRFRSVQKVALAMLAIIVVPALMMFIASPPEM